jgi:aldehyde:ferredoxin oxidoreductase
VYGFHGAYWRFDLTRGEGARVPIEASVLRRVLGGVGLGSWLLHRESEPDVDPFDPAAPLIFAFSPLVGTGLTTSAKFAVVAKSPLTGGVCDALASSHFAIAGKAMGVDAIVLVGACEEWSELVDGRLRPSANCGRSAEDTARSLAQFGRVAAIGPAGERRVRFAGLSADGRHAGRGGLGAVMGAKRLKAIAVRGEVPTLVADSEGVASIAARIRAKAAGDATRKYRDVGTVGNLLSFDRLGVLPTRNFTQGHFEGAEALSSESWRSTRSHRRSSCASCTIGCGHHYGFERRVDSEAERGPTKDETDHSQTRVEYESLFALGPLVGVADPDIVLAAASRCDELGLDTISLGATLGFAMECGEKGLLENAPSFGDVEALLEWIDAVAYRRGLGDRLAEGSKRLAESLGRGSLAFAPQVKGLELPGYEPRSAQALALGFAVGSRGADHNRSGAYELDFSDEVDRLHGDHRSAQGAVDTEDRAALFDSLILCKFVRGAIDHFYVESAELLSAVTGFDYDEEELRDVARRIVTLRKAFNIREGWRPEDDTLPDRFLSEALTSGSTAGVRLPRERLQSMIQAYNRARGWRDDGYPRDAQMAACLEGLGLEVDPVVSRADVGDDSVRVHGEPKSGYDSSSRGGDGAGAMLGGLAR